MLLKAAINGSRALHEHPALPKTPAQMATEAEASVEAGAGAIHVHVRGEDGRESLTAEAVGQTLTAVRTACPGVPVGISTGAWIVPDLDERLAQISRWVTHPDFASVNLHEEGAWQVIGLLHDQHVATEAGLWTEDAARTFCQRREEYDILRILIEPREDDPKAARATAAAIEAVLDEDGSTTPRLLHGHEETAWPMLRLAAERGYDARIGLEDVLTLPDGNTTPDNAALVRAARHLIDTV